MAIVFHKKGCNGWFDWEDRGGVVRFIEAVSGGVAQFAPEGPLPHISKGWNRRDRLSVGLRWSRQVVSPLGGMCSIQLTRHTPIHFTIDARCSSIEICYGATRSERPPKIILTQTICFPQITVTDTATTLFSQYEEKIFGL